MRKLALVAASLLLGATTLFAQNSDIESLAGLQFNFGNPGARSLGMGGAFLGLADDASAAEANPAGLTILRKAEISVEGRNYVQGQEFNVAGDFPDLTSHAFTSYSRRAEPTFASFVYPLKNSAVALYYHEPIAFQNSLAIISDSPIRFFLGPNGPVSITQCQQLGSSCTGYVLLPFGTAVDINVKTFGAAYAWKMGNFSVGLAARYQKMNESAITIRTDTNFNPIADRAQFADDHDITYSAGFKWATPSGNFSIGGAYKKGATFDAPLFFRDRSNNLGFQQVSATKFHLPNTYGIGFAYRPLPQLTVSADAVRITYSNLAENVATVTNSITSSDFRAKNVTEQHIGAEYFFGTRIPFAIRGGYWRDPAHSLEFVGPLNRFNAVAARILFNGGKDQTHYSGGVGLAWPRFQIDAAYDTSDTAKTGSLSFVTRF